MSDKNMLQIICIQVEAKDVTRMNTLLDRRDVASNRIQDHHDEVFPVYQEEPCIDKPF